MSRQPIRFISVDLPEPDGPMMATNSPGRTSKLTPRSTCRRLFAHHIGLGEIPAGYDGFPVGLWLSHGLAAHRALRSPRWLSVPPPPPPAPVSLPPSRRAQATTASPALRSPRRTSVKLSSARPSCTRCGWQPSGVCVQTLAGRVVSRHSSRCDLKVAICSGVRMPSRTRVTRPWRSGAPPDARPPSAPGRGVRLGQRSLLRPHRRRARRRPFGAIRGGSRPSPRGISRSAPHSVPTFPITSRRWRRHDWEVQRPWSFSCSWEG